MQLLLTPPLPAARRRIDRAAGGHLRVVTCVRGAASSAASSAPPAATHTPRRAEARGRGRVVAQARGFLQNLEELREEPAVTKLDYTLPLEIAIYPHPCLRAENAKLDCFDESLQELTKAMFDIMYRTDGVGLAAPQVGVNVRLMVYNPEGDPRTGEEFVLVNPTIVKVSKDTDVMSEGCLSFPKINGNVERSLRCKVKYQDSKGKKKTMQLEGWQARIFQHEYDHLEGKLFHDRMKEEVLSEVQPILTSLEEKYATENK